MKIINCIILFAILHSLVWITTNIQFVKEEWAEKSLWLAIILAIPTTLSAYYASRMSYSVLNDSVWAIRFVGHGTSYLIFPVLTWLVLKESMFTPKTLTCIALSVLIIVIQVVWK